MPKIAARLLDPDKDRAVIDKLSEDTKGPLALFTDPCWTEHGAPTERCSSPCGSPAGRNDLRAPARGDCEKTRSASASLRARFPSWRLVAAS